MTFKIWKCSQVRRFSKVFRSPYKDKRHSELTFSNMLLNLQLCQWWREAHLKMYFKHVETFHWQSGAPQVQQFLLVKFSCLKTLQTLRLKSTNSWTLSVWIRLTYQLISKTSTKVELYQHLPSRATLQLTVMDSQGDSLNPRDCLYFRGAKCKLWATLLSPSRSRPKMNFNAK